VIVVLALGSLTWAPGDLNNVLAGDWQLDGPLLPVEYGRQSKDGRLTLVVVPRADRQQVQWAETRVSDVDGVVKTLAQREGCHTDRIAVIGIDDSRPDPYEIRSWLRNQRLQYAVWTALAPKFAGHANIMPTEKEAVAYLRSLSGDTRAKAEEYIRRTPEKIRTAYRVVFEKELGWYWKPN